MKNDAKSVEEYLASLPEERRTAVQAVRKAIRKGLGKGFEEGMQYGMIGYYVPHRVYPAGYHCDPRQPLPFASIASQKNHMAVYLMCVYMDEELDAWFREAWVGAGKRLDMGKGCVRFKKLEDVPLEVVEEAVRRVPVERFVARYEENLKGGGERRARGKAEGKKKASKKVGGKKAAGKKVVGKKPAAKKKVVRKSGGTRG